MFGGTDDNYLAGFGKRWQLSWELSETAIMGDYVPAEGTAAVKALRWEWTNDLRNREPECSGVVSAGAYILGELREMGSCYNI